jgi:hypothetical protein
VIFRAYLFRSKSADMMRGFFQPKSQSRSPAPSPSLAPSEPSPTSSAISLDPPSNNDEVFTGYLSDISDDEEDGEEVGGQGGEGEGRGDEIQMSGHDLSTTLTASDTDLFRVRAPPPLKR